MSEEIKVKATFEGAAVKRGLDSVRSYASDFGKDLTSRIFGGLAGGAILGTVFSSIKGAIDQFGKIADTAAKFGLTAEEFQRVTFAAKQLGLEGDTAARVIQKLKIALADATGDEKVSRTLKAMGASVESIDNANAVKALEEISAGLDGLTDAQKLDKLKDIFGAKLAADALVLVRDLETLRREIADAPIVNEAEVAKLALIEDKLNKAAQRWDALKARVAGGLFDQGFVERSTGRTLEFFDKAAQVIAKSTNATDEQRAAAQRFLEMSRAPGEKGDEFRRQVSSMGTAGILAQGGTDFFEGLGDAARAEVSKAFAPEFVSTALKDIPLESLKAIATSQDAWDDFTDDISGWVQSITARSAGLGETFGQVTREDFLAEVKRREEERENRDQAARRASEESRQAEAMKAATAAPVADFLQSQGGGGRFFAPMIDVRTALERIAAATEGTEENTRPGSEGAEEASDSY
jgi:hypothetical protein